MYKNQGFVALGSAHKSLQVRRAGAAPSRGSERPRPPAPDGEEPEGRQKKQGGELGPPAPPRETRIRLEPQHARALFATLKAGQAAVEQTKS